MITSDPQTWPICQLCLTAIAPYFVSREAMHEIGRKAWAHAACVRARTHDAQRPTPSTEGIEQARLGLVEVTG